MPTKKKVKPEKKWDKVVLVLIKQRKRGDGKIETEVESKSNGMTQEEILGVLQSHIHHVMHQLAGKPL